MDANTIATWLAIALSLLALLGHLKTWLGSGEAAIEERLTKAEKTLVDHDRRIQAIESDVKHLPDREATHRLEIGMATLSGRLDVMAERLEQFQVLGERLQEVLLEQARK